MGKCIQRHKLPGEEINNSFNSISIYIGSIIHSLKHSQRENPGYSSFLVTYKKEITPILYRTLQKLLFCKAGVVTHTVNPNNGLSEWGAWLRIQSQTVLHKELSAELQMKPCIEEQKARSMSLLRANVMASHGCQLDYIFNQLNPSIWVKSHPKFRPHLLVTACIKAHERRKLLSGVSGLCL